jgi:hypothetical protein
MYPSSLLRPALLLSVLALVFFPLAAGAQTAESVVLPGDLIKGQSSSAVYYYYGNRYAFPNEDVYFSWYEDFSEVKTVSDAFLAGVPLAANIRFRPGSHPLKIQSDPKVYLLDRDGSLRWIPTEQDAVELYGAEWAVRVRDVDVSLFIDYTIVEPYDGTVSLGAPGINHIEDSIFRTVDDAPRPFSNPEYLRPTGVTEPTEIWRYAFQAFIPTTGEEELLIFYDQALIGEGFVKTFDASSTDYSLTYMRGGNDREIRSLNLYMGLYAYGFLPLINDTVFYERSAMLETFQDDRHTYLDLWTTDVVADVRTFYLLDAAARGWQLATEDASALETTLYFRKPGTHDWMTVTLQDKQSVNEDLYPEPAAYPRTKILLRNIDARD